jgi:8-oxo-dGTP pyrophosphatase MutT (NUDIX family)
MNWLPAPLHRAGLRVAYRGILAYRRVFRARSRGVCVVVRTGEGILLVRHSYKPGLGVPAGGLHRGEPPAEAAARELGEEVGIHAAAGDLREAGIVVSTEFGGEDHLTFFELVLDAVPRLSIDGREIIWAGFHPVAEAVGLDLMDGIRTWLERRAR